MSFNALVVACLTAALSVCSMAVAQVTAPPAHAIAGAVTVVVIAVTLVSNTEPAEALVALNDMRAMLRKQPGYLSEEFLQNLNVANAPRYVRVSRWVSMGYWAAVFGSPEFGKLNAHGNEHYTVIGRAFVPAD